MGKVYENEEGVLKLMKNFSDVSNKPDLTEKDKLPKIEFPDSSDKRIPPIEIPEGKPGRINEPIEPLEFPNEKTENLDKLKPSDQTFIENKDHSDNHIPQIDNEINRQKNSESFSLVGRETESKGFVPLHTHVGTQRITPEQRIRMQNALDLNNDNADIILDKFKTYEQYEQFIDDVNENETDDVDMSEMYVDEKGWQYDDNGNPYAYEGVLLPDTEYDLNGYHYKTDSNGRIVEVSGTLREKSHDGRKPLNVRMDDIAWGDQKEDDDRGHLIADQFDGSNESGNLTAQNKDVNRKEVKDFEQQLAKEVEAGKKVEVKITVVYEGDSNRPSAYIYDCKIDGKPVKKVFRNEASGK